MGCQQRQTLMFEHIAYCKAFEYCNKMHIYEMECFVKAIGFLIRNKGKKALTRKENGERGTCWLWTEESDKQSTGTASFRRKTIKQNKEQYDTVR